jgi:ribonuclease P protein subunit RPR2
VKTHKNISDGAETVRQIALQRINTLFSLAREVIHEDPKLAQRYVEIARKIAMRTRLRLPKEYRRMVCRHCKSFILPGVNSRVRIQQKREPHMVITCLNCGKHTRIPLKNRRRKVVVQAETANKT